MRTSCSIRLLWLALLLSGTGAQFGCHQTPTITITRTPPSDLGGPESQGLIAGQVAGFRRGDSVMLFALARQWWVQPRADAELTPIAEDGSWKATIHLGRQYAAAVIRGHFSVEAPVKDLPSVGANVLALTVVNGVPTQIDAVDHRTRLLQFGGQEWENSFHTSQYGGKTHSYLPQNAFIDSRGLLHLGIRSIEHQWTCSELRLRRELGYGTYRLTVENPKDLEAAAEFSLFTMDMEANDENHREMDFHISRWGDPKSKNAEYVLQPYYIPANVHRFDVPAGPITTILKWSPGRVEFTTTQAGKQLASWTFTASVPTALSENVFLNFCSFGYPKNPLQHDTDLIVREFEFLP